ncbi:MAG: corrinoid protein [Chloroflexi bacterium]|nr:corrinoid protein [Chloroflexota bacterium]MCY3936793.1 corrinoid protein [Chloroflexota bacterium]
MAAEFDFASTVQILHEAIIGGDANTAVSSVQDCIDNQIDAKVIVNDGMLPAMDVVGERFRRNEYYVPEVLMSARAMKMGMALVQPLLAATGAEPLGTVVIGTVRGDLHDIGKNLLGMMLEGAGFVVYDLGIDCDAQSYIDKAIETDANIIGLSALLTTTMIYFPTVVQAVKDAGLGDKVSVIVGGAPVTQDWANEVGAHGYGADAAAGVALAKRLMGVEVQETPEEAARRLLLEARDLFEVAIRRESPQQITEETEAAREVALEARDMGADDAAIQRLLEAMDREVARYQ